MNILSRENIIERSQRPLFAVPLDSYSHSAKGANLSCGDEISWYVQTDGSDTITAISHHTRACSICVASADLLAEQMTGKKLQDIESTTNESIQESLGIPLSPTRLKCALLPLATLKEIKRRDP